MPNVTGHGMTGTSRVYGGGARPLFYFFYIPHIMRENRNIKSDVQSVVCFFINTGHNHPESTVNMPKASTGDVCYTSVTCGVDDLPFARAAIPAPTVVGGSAYAAVPSRSGFSISYSPPPSLLQSPSSPPPPPPAQSPSLLKPPPPPPLPSPWSPSSPLVGALLQPHTGPETDVRPYPLEIRSGSQTRRRSS